MKFKYTLKTKIWKYLIFFSILILAVVWILNISLLGKFYENAKKKQLFQAVAQITKNYNSSSLADVLDDLTYNNDFCIEVYTESGIPLYISNNYNRGCMSDGNPLELNIYKKDFINQGLTRQNYEFINPKHNNKILMSGLKIDDTYLFINTSLEPIDSTVSVIKQQFIFITVFVLFLSFMVAYFISKHIARPIETITLSAKKLATGNFDVTFATDSTIEEMKELENTLNYAKEQLEKTETVRQELLANVSHDLKTPLTMIKAYAEMIRDLTYKNEKKRNANLNTIIEEADRLNTLVNDILELSKIKSSKVVLNEEIFEIHTLLRTIIKRYDIYKIKDGYTIQYKNKTKVNVLADKQRIEQVMYNLLNNALNYTGENKLVEVCLQVQKETVRIEIKDTGSGIDEKDIKHIWDKYYKIDKTHARVQIGSGIGLSIVKSILDKQALPFGVTSSKEGTTFYFEVKIANKNNR